MKILICDDEQTYLNTLRIHIEEYMKNHHIPCAITAVVDPLRIAQDDTVFDLAFLDIQMPGVDGITLAKELRQRNPKLALFFVTNYDCYQDDAMDLRALKSPLTPIGCMPALTKPWNISTEPMWICSFPKMPLCSG